MGGGWRETHILDSFNNQYGGFKEFAYFPGTWATNDYSLISRAFGLSR